MSADGDDTFIATTLARLDAAHEERQLEHVRAALRAPRRPRWSTVALVALAAAAMAALVTWGLVRSDEPEAPFTFGEPARTVGDGPDVTRDAAGRLVAVNAQGDGERLVFRAGRLARIEHWKGGALDGVVVDLDARGFVVSIRRYQAGVEVAPAVELDPDGRVRAPPDGRVRAPP